MAFQLNGDNGLHLSQALTDLVGAYVPDADGYIRSRLYQRKDVSHLTDKIRQIAKADMLRLYDAKQGPDGAFGRVQYRIDSSLTFNCQVYGLEAAIDDIDAMNADAALMHAQRQTMVANNALNIALEKVAVSQLRDTSVMTNNVTVAAANRWDNYASATSDPIIDLQNWITDTEARTGGKKVNRIALAKWVYNVLKNHPNVIERYKANDVTVGAKLTTSWLENLLDLEPGTIIVTSATYSNSTQPNAANQVSYLGPDCIIAHVEDGGLNDYSLGHEFAFNGYTSDPVVVLTYRDFTKGLGQDIVKVASIVDLKVTQPDAGFLAKNVVNSSVSAYLAA